MVVGLKDGTEVLHVLWENPDGIPVVLGSLLGGNMGGRVSK